ncbi:MAG: nitroreductase [Chloroflexi bacterium]|nr:nitroreductase [Chloroflexota bacterium]
MDTFDAVRTVMAVREYAGRPIPQESVRRIVEAARLTASSMNAQPWHFVVVEDREQLRRLGAAVRFGPYVANAALAIAVLIECSSQFGVSDASRAVQSMVLTAWAEGIGSNWAGYLDLEVVRPLLRIPDTLDVLVVVPFGYLARVLEGKKRRKPLSEVVHGERFGQPFE